MLSITIRSTCLGLGLRGEASLVPQLWTVGEKEMNSFQDRD